MAQANKLLDSLHVALIQYLLERIGSCTFEDPETGQMVTTPIPAAELAVMAKVLKDNGISVDKDHADDLERLQAALAKESDETNRKAIMQQAIATLAAEDGTRH